MITRRAFLRASLWMPPTLLLAVGCSGSRPGVNAQLDHGPPAVLGGTMTFTLTASSGWDAPDPNADSGMNLTAAQVYFRMTDGLVPLESQWDVNRLRDNMTIYSRQVVFQAKVPQTFEIEVRLDQPGEQRIVGVSQVTIGTAPSTEQDSLFLLISAIGTQIQDTPFSPTT